jgi:hypothetical protein
MHFLTRFIRLIEAIVTGIGVVLGLVPDPTLPRSQEVAREVVHR